MRDKHENDTIINMADKFVTVLWLYCIIIAISVCYPAEDGGNIPDSDVIKGEVEDNTGSMDINNTMLETVNQTVNETNILDVNGTISDVNSLLNENASEVINSTNSTSASSELPKYFCKGRNNSLSNGSVEQRVIIVKPDELFRWINTTVDNDTDSCAVVLFFTEHCPFCAKLAPLYNALGRVYNNLPVLAIDAYKQHSLNTRFGVVAVPTILLFHTGKPVLKFNNSFTLDDMRNFIKNNTGVEGNFTVQISDKDYLGPLRNNPVEEIDYYLLFSVLFLFSFGVVMFGKSSYRHLLWDRIQAIHWERISHWFSREKQD